MDRSSAVVAAVRDWIGTPYRHQASRKGAGCDCLGLVRGVWREVYGTEPQDVPNYTRDWGETGSRDLLLEAAGELLDPVSGAWRPGDVLVFRMRRGAVAKHLGIVASTDPRLPTFVHAYDRVGVVESPLAQSWRRRIAAVFRFPELEAN